MKTILCLLLSAVIASIPFTSQSSEVITVAVPLPMLIQTIDLPDNIPQDIQDQITIAILEYREGLFTWAEFFVGVAIVVVAGVILYCLWRCSQMIPDPQPQQPPDDPALAGQPSLFVYNLSALDSVELQVCTDLSLPEWTTVATLSNAITNVTLPKSDQMYFRLEAR